MGTSWAASLALVILTATTGSNGHASAPVGRSERGISDGKMESADNDKKFQILEMELATLHSERLQYVVKMQNLTDELDSALRDVYELRQQENLLKETVERLTRENDDLKVQLTHKDFMVQVLSRLFNSTLQKLEESSGTEIPLNNTVQSLIEDRNDTLMTTEAFSTTNISLNNTLDAYYRDKDWQELKLNLERILDQTSEAYRQLQTLPYDHGYPLWKIGGYCQVSLAEVLMSGAQGPNISESDGDTMMHGAAEGGCVRLITMMLDRDADIEARDNGGATPLVIASRYGLLSTVKLLKERGADVDAADNKGETGLYLAAQGGHLDVVVYLVTVGANVNVRNKEGVTPLMGAKSRARHAVVAYLSSSE